MEWVLTRDSAAGGHSVGVWWARSEEEVGSDEELQAHDTNLTYKASASSEVAGRQ